MNMVTTYNATGQQYGLGACKNCSICFIDDNAKKKENNSEYDIIRRIFK